VAYSSQIILRGSAINLSVHEGLIPKKGTESPLWENTSSKCPMGSCGARNDTVGLERELIRDVLGEKKKRRRKRTREIEIKL
jgi:hypothetical protein